MSLKQRKTNFVRSLSSQLDKLQEVIDQDDLSRLKIKIQMTQESLESVKSILQECISNAKTEGDVDELTNEKMEIQERCGIIIETAQAKLAEISPPVSRGGSSASSSSSASDSTSRQRDIKLPTIHIEPFTGEYSKWISFSDVFTSLVHRNESLSGSEKLQLLKNSLRGEAANVISFISVSNENYNEAWQALKDRYENKRLIVDNLLAQLFNISKATNVESLNKVINSTNGIVRALKALDLPVQHWDALLCYMLKTKIDAKTAVSWEDKQTKSIPKFNEMMAFLIEKIAHYEAEPQATFNQPAPTSSSRQNSNFKPTPACPACQQSHKPYFCDAFRRATVTERWNLIKSQRRCPNCFDAFHSANQCRSSGCKKCNKKHNTLLHDDNFVSNSHPSNQSKPSTSSNGSGSSSNTTTVATSQTSGDSNEHALLGTANVFFLNVHGQPVKARVLLDQGSQSNIITKACAKRLLVPIQSSDINVKCVGSNNTQSVVGKVPITVRNQTGKFEYTGSALVMDEITGDHPQFKIQGPLEIARGLNLADESYTTPGPIDALLGVDFYMRACRSGFKRPTTGGPGAQRTAFGWIIQGGLPKIHPNQARKNQSPSVHMTTIDPSRFWAIEEVPKVPIRNSEDKKCEEVYTSTTERQQDGRYVVRLPLSCNPPDLAESRAQAAKRFYSLERKFKQAPDFAADYRNVIQEYMDLGHMERVPKIEESKPGYYIPHHAVIKECSQSTRLRVVFDASAKTTSGKSLNDNLLTGPRLQNELFNILIRFRTHRIAITADIEKMYRMVSLNPQDRHLQRILWRDNRNLPLQEFQLTTVSFGVKSAPFLAIRTLQQLAADEGKNFPKAAELITRDFYVDDLLTGADTIADGIQIQTDLQNVLASGGFNLTKWASNCGELLEGLGCSEVSHAPVQVHNECGGVKTLGLQWRPQSDTFHFNFTAPIRQTHTKRTILSDIARLFDPLGWLSPITITGKIIFQQLWRMDTDWDTPLPQTIQNKWRAYMENLHHINGLKITRCIKGENSIQYILCGLSDASEAAYGACVYLCTKKNNSTEAHLIAAKTKVASLHATPLPRLELCAAVLLAQLLEAAESALQLPISEVHAFTDSMITLQWITNYNMRWKAFVANRVSAIHDAMPHAHWHFIPGKLNIADCITRGIPAEDLKKLNSWWYGPQILYEPLLPETINFAPTEDATTEARVTKVFKIEAVHSSQDFTHRFSNWHRLLRVIVHIIRFKNAARKLPHSTGAISVQELTEAQKLIIKNVQNSAYSSILSKNPSVPTYLQALHPIIDSENIVRVGGRLRNAEMSADQKHPILIPRDAHIATLMVRQAHFDTLHGGPQVMIANLRQRYWIIGLKNLVKRVFRNCVRCQRLRAKTCQQLMGDLPKARVTEAQPFLRTGCDFMGPFSMKTKTGRGARHFKVYVALFVCFTTRAIHLECVSDLTTSAYLASLRRFIARRGKPTDMYSDLGTNLVGGNNELKTYMEIACNEERNSEISNQLSLMGIQWHFNPGGAPHFGGLWEAGVKSTKYHLKRVIGDTALTFEELHTILCQIEAVLNSRPLVEMSDDPSDLQALTPGHFLIGRPLTAHPEPNYEDTKVSHLTRWSQLQKMVQHFWRRWHGEYLTRLQQRPKWAKPSRDLREGELVLLKDDNLPPLQWKLGRIHEVSPGADGHVRVVTVKTATGIYKRPITKVCRLPDTEISDTGSPECTN